MLLLVHNYATVYSDICVVKEGFVTSNLGRCWFSTCGSILRQLLRYPLNL